MLTGVAPSPLIMAAVVDTRCEPRVLRKPSASTRLVLPCPFAPGISGQYATYQSPSRSVQSARHPRSWMMRRMAAGAVLASLAWSVVAMGGGRALAAPVPTFYANRGGAAESAVA